MDPKIRIKSIQSIQRILSAFLILIGMASCSPRLFSYEGQTVGEENRIPLKEGSHQEQWKTGDLALNYAYRKKGDDFEITGTVVFDKHLRYNYRSLTTFFLRAYFIDSAGKIVDEQVLSSGSYLQDVEDMYFKRSLILIPDVVAVAFGYTGHAQEQSGGGILGQHDSIDWDFWKSPVR
ncbi:MAG: hypothetical protein C4530_06665 [Desulfobacteraceae bacterium]|nr:MAG: hypothetical protein C4530_06665 [Desulfobacteraceae bacterium]